MASGYILDLSLQKWGPNVRAIIKPFEVDGDRCAHRGTVRGS